MCREADRFAAAALMQPRAFSLLAERSGLNVLALQRTYRCSYASVTLRLAEVMENRPLMTVLYEREEKGDPADWAEPPALSATVVRRTRGFGNPAAFPICGERGGVPRRGRPLALGSLAERAVRYGYTQYAHEDGCAAIARPVLWKGRLAKVVVVAVPDRDQAVLGPQLVASDLPARRERPVAAGDWELRVNAIQTNRRTGVMQVKWSLQFKQALAMLRDLCSSAAEFISTLQNSQVPRLWGEAVRGRRLSWTDLRQRAGITFWVSTLGFVLFTAFIWSYDPIDGVYNKTMLNLIYTMVPLSVFLENKDARSSHRFDWWHFAIVLVNLAFLLIAISDSFGRPLLGLNVFLILMSAPFLLVLGALSGGHLCSELH